VKNILTTLLSLFATITLSAADAVTHVKAPEAAKLVQEKKVTVLDVRTPEEFKEGHIEGAKNVDFKSADFAAKLKEMDKSKPYLVHCKAGGRSTSSLKVLKELGFEKIFHLDEGIMGWEEAKLPLVK
jgi:rhodanese-related sulfurtransferase